MLLTISWLGVIHPHGSSELSRTRRLELLMKNQFEISGFVNTIASWSLLLQNWTCKVLVVTRFWTKGKSMSVCLVLMWKIGFVVRYVVLKLSHHNIRGVERWKSSSLIKVCSKIISAVVLAMDLYSASVLDLAIMFCFFELQKIRCLPRNM